MSLTVYAKKLYLRCLKEFCVVLCYHKHLTQCFEFLNDSRIICFPLNIPEKLHRKISTTLTYSEPEAYSEPRHINNPDIFRTLTYEAYSEPLQTSTMMRFAKIVNGYNCFHEL